MFFLILKKGRNVLVVRLMMYLSDNIHYHSKFATQYQYSFFQTFSFERSSRLVATECRIRTSFAGFERNLNWSAVHHGRENICWD